MTTSIMGDRGPFRERQARPSAYEIQRLMRNPPEDLSYELLLQISEYLGDVKSRAAPQKVIAALPIEMYHVAKRRPTTESATNASDATDRRCVICLTEFEEQDTVKEMHCSHYFHVECLDKWLRYNSTCPICRYSCFPAS